MSSGLDIKRIKAQRPEAVGEPARPAAGEGGVWALLNKDIRLGGSGLPDRIKESFYLELWTLLEAGIDIRTALELIRDEQKKQRIKAVFNAVLNEIVSGATLSASLQQTKQFSSYEFFSVQIGEETGKLTGVLKDLSGYFQQKIKQRRQIVGALTYPVVILVIAFAAVSFMISYVVPMFSDVFSRFGNDLPAVTKLVIAASAFAKKYTGVFGFTVLLLAGLALWQRKKDWYRRWVALVLLRIPVIGPMVQKIWLARFANTMSLLTGARIPIVQAIQLTRQMVGFYPIEHSLHEAEQAIVTGTPLYKALSSFPVYPPKMISMIKVGEEVNQLELFFTRVAEQYAHEVEHQTTVLSKFLEPLIIVILGLVVGVILIAMYLPLFKLGQGF